MVVRSLHEVRSSLAASSFGLADSAIKLRGAKLFREALAFNFICDAKARDAEPSKASEKKKESKSFTANLGSCGVKMTN
jgi:hypothetical protein